MNAPGSRLSLSRGQRRLVALLRRHPIQSRAFLAEQLEVSQPAISKQVQELMTLGLVVEAARRTGRRGPPQIDLKLNADAIFALGIHADSESVHVVLLDFCGAVRGEFGLRNAFSDFEDAQSAIVIGARQLLAEAGRDLGALAGACIALPARFVSSEGALNLADAVGTWRGVDIADRLSTRLGCDVTVENDANAAALSEVAIGNPDGYASFFYIYIADGLGGALVLDHQLYRGAHGNAGEIGALRPRSTRRPSLGDLARNLGKDAPPPSATPEVWNNHFAARPDLYAPWLDRAAAELHELLFVVRTLFDPEAIFVGGTMAMALREALIKRARELRPPHHFVAMPPIVASQLGGLASAAQGAAVSVFLEGAA
ncbi:ROK family transcriptional regulator [Jiella sp. MQZ9-1]|uniref:ROK family transcriptional regulator n=1 Tax=Jiella flava TaxID=2816857 RepID=A0A939FZ24_9HYPH|nr:ROK family transcriptional regulator [Jiella flava]MBO0664215.1 ROK family transcriptional regulator [Jiella flava]MCD2472861.1 ROK family transcriptional regulator [Jiella flava]